MEIAQWFVKLLGKNNQNPHAYWVNPQVKYHHRGFSPPLLSRRSRSTLPRTLSVPASSRCSLASYHSTCPRLVLAEKAGLNAHLLRTRFETHKHNSRIYSKVLKRHRQVADALPPTLWSAGVAAVEEVAGDQEEQDHHSDHYHNYNQQKVVVRKPRRHHCVWGENFDQWNWKLYKT